MKGRDRGKKAGLRPVKFTPGNFLRTREPPEKYINVLQTRSRAEAVTATDAHVPRRGRHASRCPSRRENITTPFSRAFSFPKPSQDASSDPMHYSGAAFETKGTGGPRQKANGTVNSIKTGGGASPKHAAPPSEKSPGTKMEIRRLAGCKCCTRGTWLSGFHYSGGKYVVLWEEGKE